MAEAAETTDAEGVEEGATPGGAGAAIAMALGRLKPGARLAPEAAAFLKQQTHLAGLQAEHLKVQERHLRLRYFGDRLRIGLQLLGIGFGLAIAVAVAAVAWNAHQDHGVAIEAFSVPPELAQRGLTGQVVASKLLDQLAGLQAKTVTARPASSYANDWGGDIKVEIPETGVSIGELNRYLREWLGSETRIGGEIVRTPSGLAVTARVGASQGATFEGPDADLDRLMQQAAEAVYARTQPYRHAVYLSSQGRTDEALKIFQRLAASGSREDRPWAYAAWATQLAQQGDFAGARRRALQALAFGITDEAGALTQLNMADHFLSHWEAELGDARLFDRANRAGHGNPQYGRPQDWLGYTSGDYRWAVAHPRTEAVDVEGVAAGGLAPIASIQALGRGHDLSGARRLAGASSGFPGDVRGLDIATPLVALDTTGFATFSTDDWPSVERGMRLSVHFSSGEVQRRFIAATLAAAIFGQGRQAEAEQLIAETPLDCDICVDVRAVIAARRGDWPAAERWLALLERRSPSLPFAPTEHAKLLLDRGETDRAVTLLQKAHALSPHFADALELWGEALMRKGDFHGAAEKFGQADESAPRWGRNHLLWGEALLLTGRYPEARAQFEAAIGMDLSRADRAALNVFLDRTARGPLRG